MEKREKILLILMLLGIGYVAYSFLFAGQSGEPVVTVEEMVNPQELENIKTEASTLAASVEFKDEERYRLTNAEKPLVSDPFVDRDALQAQAGVQDEKTALRTSEGMKIAYTGFIVLDDVQLAIINGMEYEIGEELEMGGYYVTAIDKQHVILGAKNEEDTIVDQLVVPIEEDVINLYSE